MVLSEFLNEFVAGLHNSLLMRVKNQRVQHKQGGFDYRGKNVDQRVLC